MSDRILFQITGTSSQKEVEIVGESFNKSVKDSVKEAPEWDDMRFPLIARNIDVSSGRVNYDYFNQTVKFQSNARYPNEPVSIPGQMWHRWQEGSEILPHIHWLQQGTDIPNWVLGHRVSPNGELTSIETDFSSYTFTIPDSHVYTYASGILRQISTFPAIDMTGQVISCLVDTVLFRDTNNTLGLYTGTDPSGLDEHIRDFDMHVLGDSSNGSTLEFIKQ